MRLAAAFDVGLVVRFVPFSEMIDWISGTPRVNKGLGSEALEVPAFDQEEELGLLDRPAPAVWQLTVGGPKHVRNYGQTNPGAMTVQDVGPTSIHRKPVVSEYGSAQIILSSTNTGVTTHV